MITIHHCIVLSFVFLSGVTGLVYQVTWQKYLSIYLGSHALSATLTLSSFFLFLSFGYSLVGRYGHRISKNRILSYAIIEGLIGIFSILSPSLFSSLYEIWPTYPSESWLHFVSSYGFALCLTGLPTLLMGATIPLLTQGLSEKLEEGHKIHAWVYGLNTLGAFLGALLTGFYILESFGLAQTLNLVGTFNCLICLFALVYLKVSQKPFSGFEPRYPQSRSFMSLLKNPFLTIAFFSGLSTFAFESLVIRVAGNSLGSSVYTYSLVVSAFIVCIALGTLLSAKVSDKRGAQALGLTQLLLLTSLAGLYFLIPRWPDFFFRLKTVIYPSAINLPILWSFVFLVFALFLIVPVGLMGMTLPLVFQQLKNKGTHLSETAGAMYSINAIGSAIGAILGGYVLFRWLSFSQVYNFVVLVTFLSTLFSFLTLAKDLGASLVKWGAALALIPMFIIIYAGPWAERSFVPSRFSVGVKPKTTEELEKIQKWFNDGNESPKIIWSDYGPNTFTTVTENKKGDRALVVNSKPDAETSGDRLTRGLTALFPALLSPNVDKTFIIGLGTGMSTGLVASLPDSQKVKVVEIARGAVKALPLFEKWNFNLEDNRHKVSILNDDAYKVLKNEPEQYDMILSEPSSIWVTGVEKIYTTEFLEKAAKRLKPEGSYSQWFPIFGLDEDSFLSILRNFQTAFHNVTVWDAGGGRALMIIGRHRPVQISEKHLADKGTLLAPILKEFNFKNTHALLARQIFSESDVKRLASFAKTEHSLYHPTLSYRAGRAHFVKKNINLEKLVHKYFVPVSDNPALENLPTQDLVWQKNQDLLTKSFYTEAQQYLAGWSHLNFLKGRISMAFYENFPEDVAQAIVEEQKKERPSLKSQIAKHNAKVRHYAYLRDSESSLEPLLESRQKNQAQRASHKVAVSKEVQYEKNQSKEKLFSEVTPKYRALRKMRYSAKLDRVLDLAPRNCQSEDCIRSKLDLLDIHFKEELLGIKFEKNDSKENKAKNHAKIEAFFSDRFRRL